jgi:hypothetical protein
MPLQYSLGNSTGLQPKEDKMEKRTSVAYLRAKSRVRLVALLAVVTVAVPVLAKPIYVNVHIPTPSKLGSKDLRVGAYTFVVDGTDVTVKQGSKIVATAQGHWEERGKSPEDTLMKGSNGEVLEVRTRGQKRVLVLDAR